MKLERSDQMEAFTALPLASRVVDMPDSPMRFLSPYADAAVARGIRVFKMELGNPPFDMPDVAWRACRRQKTGKLGYADTNELQVRLAWEQHYQRYGIPLLVKHIVLTDGGSEAILFVLGASCSFQSDLLVLTPSYPAIFGWSAFLGIDVISCPLNKIKGYSIPSDDELQANLTPNTQAVFLVNPNNPTGTYQSESDLRRLILFCRRKHLRLIVDETYRYLVFGMERTVSIFELAEGDPNVVGVDTTTKWGNTAGLRAGNAACLDEDFVAGMVKIARNRLCPNVLGMRGVVPLLQRTPRELAIIRDKYERQVDVTCNHLQEIEGVHFERPGATFYVLITVEGVNDTAELAKYLLTSSSYQDETTFIAPGFGYHPPSAHHLGKHDARIACLLGPRLTPRAIRSLAFGIDGFRKLHRS